MKWNGSLTSSCAICGWHSPEVRVPTHPNRIMVGSVVWLISAMYDLHFLRRHLMDEARAQRGRNQ